MSLEYKTYNRNLCSLFCGGLGSRRFNKCQFVITLIWWTRQCIFQDPDPLIALSLFVSFPFFTRTCFGCHSPPRFARHFNRCRSSVCYAMFKNIWLFVFNQAPRLTATHNQVHAFQVPWRRRRWNIERTNCVWRIFEETKSFAQSWKFWINMNFRLRGSNNIGNNRTMTWLDWLRAWFQGLSEVTVSLETLIKRKLALKLPNGTRDLYMWGGIWWRTC